MLNEEHFNENNEENKEKRLKSSSTLNETLQLGPKY